MRYLEPNSADSIGRHTCPRCGGAWPCQRHPPRSRWRVVPYLTLLVLLVSAGMYGAASQHPVAVFIATPIVVVAAIAGGSRWL